MLANFSKEEVDLFCDKEYSKQVFGTNLPLLVRVPRTAASEDRHMAVKDKNVNRWTWKYSFVKENYEYAISTQWGPRNHDAVRRWLNIHESNNSLA